MAKQLHKRFSTEEVKMLLQKYLDNKKKLPYILGILKIRRRFFEFLKEYRKGPDGSSIEYKRKKPTRKIPDEIEKNITAELGKEKELIDNKEVPINYYNYSYIKDQLKGQKKMNFYKKGGEIKNLMIEKSKQSISEAFPA